MHLMYVSKAPLILRINDTIFLLAGDARNEVMTTRELSKLKFDPSIYRANALQGLVYDPARELPHIHCCCAHSSICVMLSGIC